jgi:hypothetical protein
MPRSVTALPLEKIELERKLLLAPACSYMPSSPLNAMTLAVEAGSLVVCAPMTLPVGPFWVPGSVVVEK